MMSKKKKSSLMISRKLQKSLQALLISLVAFSFFWAAQKLTSVELPASEDPPLLYSTQLGDDLTLLLQTSIRQAKKSVILIIYTLTDPKIIKALKHKSEEGISVLVVCDGRAAPFIDRKLGPAVKVVKRFGDGIMHQKILVVDDSLVWIGSANMTGESLNMHANLITGFNHPALGEMITHKADTQPEEGLGVPFAAREFLVGGQKAEMWFLPDNPRAVHKIKSLIAGAKKSIRIAMFTWTRMDFAEEAARSLSRGINVSVALDRSASKGAGAKVSAYLQKKGVPVYLYQGPGLLHHKFMEIDNEILVNGSANWTKAAFDKNDDCFFVLHDLTEKQQDQMDKLWKGIIDESIKEGA
jgi:phosphatidylserine/phosphatidylglycerophosphate/cardiolipin synthase-like enzyme